MMEDLLENNVTRTFDLTTDYAPLTLGLDVPQFSKRDFVSPEATTTFQRPSDNSPGSGRMYACNEFLSRKAHFNIIGLVPGSLMLTSTSTSHKLYPDILSKRLHHYTHTQRLIW